MRIHLIAIGGKVMHNLALELQANGHYVSGSDDEIYDPARQRLDVAGLLPDKMGWNPSRITADIELIILGMHAHADNPELLRAQALNLKVVSFPEYAGEAYRDKEKIVVAGSHGKSTTTAMIMHVFRSLEFQADYLLGGMLEGFDRMVSIGDADVVVIEGDEYLSSRIDPTPKMMHYHGDIIVITGIEWDHKNVFPTYESYVLQFSNLITQARENGSHIIWYENDEALSELMSDYPEEMSHPYKGLDYQDGVIIYEDEQFELQIFGRHNLANMNAALLACDLIGVDGSAFCTAMCTFSGVGNRLELVHKDPITFKDYAHAPSKVRATVQAVRERYPDKRLLVIYELHTYSSLSQDFLINYRGTLDAADRAIVCYDPHALEMKRLPALAVKEVQREIGLEGLIVVDDPSSLPQVLVPIVSEYDVLLFMSSGTFGGLDIEGVVNGE